MRLRTLVATGLGTLALTLALPASAGAATGEFSYLHPFTGAERVVVQNPQDHECLTLPQTQDPWSPPAHSPRNRTSAPAEVFTGPHCTGDSFTMRPFTGYGTERLKVRSVRFG